MNSVVVIYGPTAVGKSAIAVKLAKMIDGEIISADSMQIYRHLDVGSAKVTKEEMEGIPHYLINIKEPTENYSAGQFCHDAKKSIDNIIARGHIPIVVGGTGLYLKGLIENYSFANLDRNEEFRKTIENYSNEQLFEKIKALSPNLQVDCNNRRRLIRMLEILTFSNSKNLNDNQHQSNYNFLLFAILDDRQKIYDRINTRVDKMIENGLLDEAKYIFSLNLTNDNLAVKAIGYKELFPYIKKEKSLNECLDDLKQKSRNYAKRQITFLNQFKKITIVNFEGVEQTASNIYDKIKGEIN